MSPSLYTHIHTHTLTRPSHSLSVFLNFWQLQWLSKLPSSNPHGLLSCSPSSLSCQFHPSLFCRVNWWRQSLILLVPAHANSSLHNRSSCSLAKTGFFCGAGAGAGLGVGMGGHRGGVVVGMLGMKVGTGWLYSQNIFLPSQKWAEEPCSVPLLIELPETPTNFLG